jgi:hypothetical protein
MATGAVREFAVPQHGIQKIAALRDFCPQRIVRRCDWIDRFFGIQRMDGGLGCVVPLPQIGVFIFEQLQSFLIGVGFRGKWRKSRHRLACGLAHSSFCESG